MLWTNIFGNQNKNEFQKHDHTLCYCGNAKLLSKFLNISSEVVYSFHPERIPNSPWPGTGPGTTSVGILLVDEGSTHSMQFLHVDLHVGCRRILTWLLSRAQGIQHHDMPRKTFKWPYKVLKVQFKIWPASPSTPASSISLILPSCSQFANPCPSEHVLASAPGLPQPPTISFPYSSTFAS